MKCKRFIKTELQGGEKVSMKKSIFFLTVLTVMMLLAACGGSSEGSTDAKTSEESGTGEVYTLKINTALAQTDPIYQGLEAFKASVAEKTNDE